jgi:hypothetical protein
MKFNRDFVKWQTIFQALFLLKVILFIQASMTGRDVSAELKPGCLSNKPDLQ